MVRRRKIDASKVFEAVESGKLSKDVMDSFGLEKPGAPAKSRGRRRRKDEETELDVIFGDITVTKRGSLVLPKEMVEQLGYGEDDVFIARKTKAGIILKPV